MEIREFHVVHVRIVYGLNGLIRVFEAVDLKENTSKKCIRIIVPRLLRFQHKRTFCSCEYSKIYLMSVY